MYLQHVSTITHFNGTIDVTVMIVNEPKAQEYTFTLMSEDVARKFHALYKKGKNFHGRALVLLKRNRMKE